MSIGVKLDTKELDRIAKQLGVKTDRVGMRFAFQVEAAYKQAAPIDTGAMANSCYVEGKSESNYDQAAGAAQRLNPDANLDRHPKPSGDVIANVGPAVEYAQYVEFGTSRQAAQPTLGPAVDSLAGKFNSGKEWEEIVK